MEEEEAMPTPVQETPLTACPPPSTAASIGNLEYLEEPLPTVASVASSEFPEMLLMVLTVFSYEYSDLPRADDSNISPEQTFEVCCMELIIYAHVPYLCMQFVYSTYSISCYLLYVLYVYTFRSCSGVFLG